MTHDRYYLNLALQLAAANEGATGMNPSVGAVIVRDERMIAWGNHAGAGQPHAEVVALQMAGEGARNSTLYCTLEPCAHTGKTPPCADAIRAAGISRVVFGATDQNPLVDGKGFSVLREAGVTVEHLQLHCIDSFYRSFFHIFQSRRPYVVAKVAMTANGIISPADRNSRWITNPLSLEWVHQLRAQCDAILVGADTVLLDRPHLTVRADGIVRRPLRIVVDARFKLNPDNCSLLESDEPVLICAQESAPGNKAKAWEKHGVRTMRFRTAEELLQNILSMDIRKVLVEGGQKIFTLFHTAGVIDEYIMMIAPRLLTGRHFLNFLGGPEQSLADASRFSAEPPLEFDGDILLRFKRASR